MEIIPACFRVIKTQFSLERLERQREIDFRLQLNLGLAWESSLLDVFCLWQIVSIFTPSFDCAETA